MALLEFITAQEASMRGIFSFWRVFALLCFVAVVGVATVAVGQVFPASATQAANASRACAFVGHWTNIACTNLAAARSGQLIANARYVMQCDDDSRFATGTATITAAGTDGWLPYGDWLDFYVLDSGENAYVSCLNVTKAAGCKYIQCR